MAVKDVNTRDPDKKNSESSPMEQCSPLIVQPAIIAELLNAEEHAKEHSIEISNVDISIANPSAKQICEALANPIIYNENIEIADVTEIVSSKLEKNCSSIVDTIDPIDIAEISSKDAIRCFDTSYNLDLLSIGMYEIDNLQFMNVKQIRFLPFRHGHR